MTDDLPLRTQMVVERGGGYWCFRVPEPQTQAFVAQADEPAATPDEVTFPVLDVYYPVNVSINDKGEPYAWFHYDYDDPMKAVEMNGRRFVMLQQVYPRPLPGFVDIRNTDAELP